MVKGTETFKKIIKGFLDNRAANDVMFAARYAKEGKSVDECCDYIIEQVKKSGCNGFADEEIFGMAIHYYDEDDAKPQGKISDCTVVVNLSDHTKEELEKRAQEEYQERLIAELEAKEKAQKESAKRKAQEKKQKEEATGQLSLFDI
jgi:hypothetical protein